MFGRFCVRVGAWVSRTVARRGGGGVLSSEADSGRLGERLACEWLRSHGFRVLFTNYRTSFSEIDIIALEGQTLVFVEVKTWTSPSEGGPADAIDEDKQARITRAALAFLKSRKLLENPSRFDVIEVILDVSGKPLLRHYPHAFEAVGEYQWFR